MPSKIQVDEISNLAGTGGPDFPKGLSSASGKQAQINGNANLVGIATLSTVDAAQINSTGIVTATTFSGSAAGLTGLPTITQSTGCSLFVLGI
jgi:hypothetical protein